jgi:peptidoglycan/LPS O-acetylase OafA/YrhL
MQILNTRDATRHNTVFDCYRGILALLVAAYHFLGEWSGWKDFNISGYLAVDMFFVLSGFVLAPRFLNSSNENVTAFVHWRLSRMYPLHLVTLFAFIALWCLINGTISPTAGESSKLLFQQLFMIHNVGLNPFLVYNEPSWSISVEFIANVSLFILFRITRSRIVLILMIATGYSLLLVTIGTLNTHVANVHGLNSGLIRGLSGILLGVFTFTVSQAIRLERNWCTAIQVALLVILAWAMFNTFGSPYSRLDYLVPFLFAALLVFTKRTSNFLIMKLSYLGIISYSLYLWATPVHRLMFFLFKNWLSKTSTMFIFLIIILFVAHFSYQLIEVPLRNYLRTSKR